MLRVSRWNETVRSLLVNSGVARLARLRFRRRCAILVYHNIVPDGTQPSGDRSLHLERARFAEHLDLLVDFFDVVALETLALGEQGSHRRPRVAVTFDDAYRGAVTLAVNELAQRRLPATIFVAPGFVGGRTFWWDDLAGLGAEGLTEHVRRRALEEFGGVDAEIRKWAVRDRLRLAHSGKHAIAATEDELKNAVRRGEMTLASHSWSHRDLTSLQPMALRAELQRSLGWLQARFTQVIPWIAYPYGLSSPSVHRAAALVGYEAGVTVGGRWLPRRNVNPFLLPRINVPANLSCNGLCLRLAGLWAV